MTREKAIKVLTAHNIWRQAPLGTGGYGKIQDQEEIGLAIDLAVANLKAIVFAVAEIKRASQSIAKTRKPE